MGNIRVHELVRELRKSNREVTDRLRKLGIPARTNLQSLTLEEANQIRVSFGFKPVKEKVPKKKAAKKPEKKAARKTAKKPAAKKPAAKKPAKKAEAKKPSKAAQKPKKAGAEKAAISVAVKEKPEPKVGAIEPKSTKVPQVEAAVKEKGTARTVKPKPERPLGPPGVTTRPKKPTFRVAPADVKRAPAAPPVGDKKVYRFVPRGRRVARGPKAAPSTVAPKLIRVPSGITCLLYTSDAADDLLCVDLGGRRIIKK